MQRKGWLYFRAPKGQDLSLLFPLDCILISWTLQKHWGGRKGGRATHCGKGLVVPVALLHADRRTWAADPKSAHSPCSRAPGSCRQVFGDYGKCEELKISLRHTWSWSAREITVSPKSSQPGGQPWALSAQLTASQLPTGSLKPPSLPARHEAGWRQKKDMLK